jgi:hypothetical protein
MLSLIWLTATQSQYQGEISVDKYYELWHLTSGNLVGDFVTVDDVFDALWRAHNKAGLELTDEYMLLECEGDDETIYAEGEELLNLIMNHKHALSR